LRLRTARREPPPVVEVPELESLVRIVSMRAVGTVEMACSGVTARAAQGGPGV